MTVRFGVVGTAYWAADVHAPGLRAARGVGLVGIHGRSQDKTEAAAERNGVKAFALFDDMLEAVDAVSIAVSPDAQPGYAVRAAEAGKHLLLDKPVALDTLSARRIADAVAANGVAAIVCFARRFIPEVAEAIRRERGRPWTHATVRVHAAPLDSDSPYRNSVWRAADGAALWDIGPHALSVLLPMMGPVVEARRLPAEPDHIHLCFRHEGGGQSDVSLTLRAARDRKEQVYEFAGPEGTIRLPEPAFDRVQMFAGAATEFADMIARGERSHECGLDLGLETVRILESVAANHASA